MVEQTRDLIYGPREGVEVKVINAAVRINVKNN